MSRDNEYKQDRSEWSLADTARTRLERELKFSDRQLRVMRAYTDSRHRIDPKDFPQDQFPKVLEDLQNTKRLEQLFDPSGNPAATFLENWTVREATVGEWFGSSDSVRVVETSEFDDYIHGVDFVLEWCPQDGAPALQLGVDVTTALTRDVVAKKRSKIETAVTYFTSAFSKDGNVTREALDQVPVVTIGIDREYITALVDVAAGRLSYQNTIQKEGGVKREPVLDHECFREHPARILFLEQMIAQLNAQVDQLAVEVVNTAARQVRGKKEERQWQDLLRDPSKTGVALFNELASRKEVVWPLVERGVIPSKTFVGMVYRVQMWGRLVEQHQAVTKNAGPGGVRGGGGAKALRGRSHLHEELTRPPRSQGRA